MERVYYYLLFNYEQAEAMELYESKCNKMMDKIIVEKKGFISKTLRCMDIKETFHFFIYKDSVIIKKILTEKKEDLYNVIIDIFIKSLEENKDYKIKIELLYEKIKEPYTEKKLKKELNEAREYFSKNIIKYIELKTLTTPDMEKIAQNFKGITVKKLKEMEAKQENIIIERFET